MSLRDELLSPDPRSKSRRRGPALRSDLRQDQGSASRRRRRAAGRVGDRAEDGRLAARSSSSRRTRSRTKSKDLQIAAWLTEALLRREGFAGLRDGLDAPRRASSSSTGIISIPEIDDGDAEMRAAPLEWVGAQARRAGPHACRSIEPATTRCSQREARTVPTEAGRRRERATRRRRATDGDRRTARRRRRRSTPASPRRRRRGSRRSSPTSSDRSRRSRTLDEVCAGKVRRTSRRASRASARRSKTCSASRRSSSSASSRSIPIRSTSRRRATASRAAGDVVLPGSATGAAGRGSLTPEPTSRDDATSRIVGAARYLRAQRSVQSGVVSACCAASAGASFA